MKNVLEWLEFSTKEYKNQVVYEDINDGISFEEVYDQARRIGTGLAGELKTDIPVAVFMDRNIKTPVAYLGVVYSGRAYAPIDAKLPQKRIEKILELLQPEAILTERHLYEDICKYSKGRNLYCYEELQKIPADDQILGKIRKNMVETDPLYIIFTSGSSGTPKGVVTSHRSVMVYLDAYAGVMELVSKDRIGNQSPLDYIAAVRDIYLPLKLGCSMHMIPKKYFMEPVKLFEFLNEKKITSVGWSVSAFTLMNSMGAFDEGELTSLQKICFSGSVMPCKDLRIWQEHLPDAQFVNQYGSTEITASCTYYVVDHLVEEEEVLPIGEAYEGYRVFLLNDSDKEPVIGEPGEICVTGPIIALGYYGNPEAEKRAFVINPLKKQVKERMYRTGDVGILGEDGLLYFHGRKDRQIKHMGHRVELDEIEYAANQQKDVVESCCIYEKEKEKLHLFYTGTMKKRELAMELRKLLPGFMVPRRIHQVEALPKLPNGKLDMKKIEGML